MAMHAYNHGDSLIEESTAFKILTFVRAMSTNVSLLFCHKRFLLREEPHPTPHEGEGVFKGLGIFCL